jgi:hypothetical protein
MGKPGKRIRHFEKRPRSRTFRHAELLNPGCPDREYEIDYGLDGAAKVNIQSGLANSDRSFFRLYLTRFLIVPEGISVSRRELGGLDAVSIYWGGNTHEPYKYQLRRAAM